MRRALTSVLERTLKLIPVVVLTGARQTGKSTLVRHAEALAPRRYLSLDTVVNRGLAMSEPHSLLWPSRSRQSEILVRMHEDAEFLAVNRPSTHAMAMLRPLPAAVCPRPLFRCGRLPGDGHDPKANADGGMVLEVAIPPGGTLMDGVTVVATTAGGMRITGRRSLRIGHRIAGIGTKPALAPLPDVSQHVIETKAIRRLLSNSMGRTAGVAPIPGNGIQRPIGLASAASSGGVFPLRFCR